MKKSKLSALVGSLSIIGFWVFQIHAGSKEFELKIDAAISKSVYPSIESQKLGHPHSGTIEWNFRAEVLTMTVKVLNPSKTPVSFWIEPGPSWGKNWKFDNPAVRLDWGIQGWGKSAAAVKTLAPEEEWKLDLPVSIKEGTPLGDCDFRVGFLPYAGEYSRNEKRQVGPFWSNKIKLSVVSGSPTKR